MTATEISPERMAQIEAERERLMDIVRESEARKAAKAHEEAHGGRIEAIPVIEEADATCETCKGPFRAKVGVMAGIRLVARNCAACCDDYERRNNPDPATIQQAREASWLAMCPSEYRDTDAARVKFEVGEETFARVNGWTRDRGLGLIGSTGRCKTRLMFLMLRKHAMAGARVRYINAVNFADELADSYARGSHDAERWMKEIERVPLLFIDDLGKEKLTERVETFYYRATEFRTANGLPIFFTSNLTGKALQARWDDAAHRGQFWADRAAPIIRRLRDRCTSITV